LIYILWGEDEFSISEALQNIKDSCGESSLLITNTSVFEGQKLTASELRSVGEALPFLSPKRLIIVRGLLERFEPKDKVSRTQASKPNSKSEESKELADCMSKFPDSTVLVLIDSIEARKNALSNNSLFKLISDNGEVKSFPPIKGVKLSQWIESRVNRRGGSISRQATNILMDIIGGDLYTMSNEVDKLVAFTGGRLIEEKDIRTVVSASQEADVFSMIDAIMDHQSGLAEQLLQKLLQNGTVPPQILVLLARQIQIMVQLKDLKRLKTPTAEIQSKLGIFNPFAWNKLSARAEKYTPEKLKKIYQKILETDLAIKTGKCDGDLAIGLLVASLSIS
jgi:DNA polymerase III subunit delta